MLYVLLSCICFDFFFFFFQAEDGIRDHCVTGVQTCALPISPPRAGGVCCPRGRKASALNVEHSSAPVFNGTLLWVFRYAGEDLLPSLERGEKRTSG